MEKIFKIKDLKVVFICPEHDEKYLRRKDHMMIMLSQNGFTDFHHFVSGTERYPSCLSKAIADVLKQNLNDEPILILEDDVEFTGIDAFSIEKNFSDLCDAVYLGISKSGGHPYKNDNLGNAVFQHLNEKQVRVFNMLSHHAVLYLTKRYKEKCIEVLEKSLESKEPFYNDVAISQIQKDFFIIANKIPSFYQSSKFGPEATERCTRFGIHYVPECQHINFWSLNE